MEDPIAQDSHSLEVRRRHEALLPASPVLVEASIDHANKSIHPDRQYQGLPPSPPHTDDNASDHGFVSNANYPLPPVSFPPTEVLEVDKKTPDAHVPRDSRLIRLTGVHPFNAEASLSTLFNEGFLTSPELFYVRNHGAVPEVIDSEIPDWELSITGYYKFLSLISSFMLV